MSPDKYWLLATAESGEQNLRPTAYDPTERARLRREAQAANIEISLLPCQRTKDQIVKFTAAK